MKTSNANFPSLKTESENACIHFDGECIEAKSTKDSALIVKHFSKTAIGYTCSSEDDAIHKEIRDLRRYGYRVALTVVSKLKVNQFVEQFVINRKSLEEDDVWENYLAAEESGMLTPSQHRELMNEDPYGFLDQKKFVSRIFRSQKKKFAPGAR